MWRTSEGDRILQGAERSLFVRGLAALVGWVEDEPDWEVGVKVFDVLSAPEKLGVLEQVGSALLREEVPPPPLTAVNEGAIAAIYARLMVDVDLEIDAGDGLDERGFISRACNGRELSEGVPAVGSEDREAWHEALERLADRILWDRDWAEAMVQPDDPPDKAKAVRDFARIDADYYSEVAPDPNAAQLEAIRTKLEALCRNHA